MIGSKVILFWCPGTVLTYKRMRNILSFLHEARCGCKEQGLHQPLENCATPQSAEGADVTGKGSSGGYVMGGKKGTQWWLDIRDNEKGPSRFFIHSMGLNERHRIRHTDQERMSVMEAI